MEQDFEQYFRRRLEEDRETIEELPYTLEELRKIYFQEYEWQRNKPVLDLKLDSQPLNYKITQYYLPEKWEMPRDGKLLYSDEDLLDVLRLIIYNLGVEKALDSIPRNLIQEYLDKE